ncbi:lysostaphin resistance A-like protein [Nocardioides sp.]|uniref:CPBP family intramembrane glutamic endopeptidase n=1 Tax=Nocardioides sp. TaxID=35761 RepID=UPI0039E2B2DC
MTPGLAYQELHRGGSASWWRALLGVVTEFLLFFLVPLGMSIPVIVWLLVRGLDQDGVTTWLSFDPVTPGNLAFLNLTLAAMIPVTMLVTFLCHGWLKPGWIASVAGRIRWRWLAVCLGLAVVALVATLVVSVVLPSGGDDLGGSVNEWTSRSWEFLLVILLLTPLQAVGEEYVFRGYLTQAVGGVTRGRWLAVLVPALIFALAHGTQSAPVFIDRFAFGLVAGVLVIMTGGLEAGIAMHVLNNLLAFGLALFFGDLTETLQADGGSWWMIPATLTQSLVYLGLAGYAARRLGIARRTADTVLVASAAPV